MWVLVSETIVQLISKCQINTTFSNAKWTAINKLSIINLHCKQYDQYDKYMLLFKRHCKELHLQYNQLFIETAFQAQNIFHSKLKSFTISFNSVYGLQPIPLWNNNLKPVTDSGMETLQIIYRISDSLSVFMNTRWLFTKGMCNNLKQLNIDI